MLKMLQLKLSPCRCILFKISNSLRKGIPGWPRTIISITLKLCYLFHKREAKHDQVFRSHELPPGDFLRSDKMNCFLKPREVQLSLKRPFSSIFCCLACQTELSQRISLTEFIHGWTLIEIRDLQCITTAYRCCLHILLLLFSSCSRVQDPKLLC